MRILKVYYLVIISLLFSENCYAQNSCAGYEYLFIPEKMSSQYFIVAEIYTSNDFIGGRLRTTFFIDTIDYTTPQYGYGCQNILFYLDNIENDFLFDIEKNIPVENRYRLENVTIRFSKEDIQNHIFRKYSNGVNIDLHIYRKARINDVFPKILCKDDHEFLMTSLESDVSIGSVSGEIQVEGFSRAVNSENFAIPISDLLQNNQVSLNKELEIVFNNNYFQTTSSQIGVFILSPPPPLTVSPPEIPCNGGSVESLTISGFPDNATDASLRIDITKLGTKASYQGAIPDTTINGVDYFWLNQQTAILTDEEINPINNSITLDAESVTDNNFEIDEGLYEINVFYYDGVSSLCPSTTFFTVDEPDPLELRLDLETYSTSGGTEYKIPVHGGTVKIDGSVSGNQGGYSLQYEDENGTSETFVFNNTQLGAGKYTFFAEDDAGCQSNTVSLKLDEPGPIKIDTTFYFPKCNSANSDTKSLFTGSIEFLIESGGIPDFYAECVNNETNDTTVIDSFSQTETQKFSELEPGAYTLKIWDNGDTARERAPVFSKDFSISEKAEMTLTHIAAYGPLNC